MATKRKSNGKRRARSGTATRGRRSSSTRRDAISLLKADHRQVEDWFGEFKSARSGSRKATLAGSICDALKVHTSIEEEIFYPAFLEAAGDEEIHHEAEVEHAGAKELISQIEQAGPEDEYFEARVNVLAEMIRHHVREEEKPDGMFAKARRARMDLAGLGERLAERKSQLRAGSGDRLRIGKLGEEPRPR
jgi:hemerythrin superfamily protein